ncbi:neutral zinc metallopeptidase [Herbidospora sp. RD11066]
MLLHLALALTLGTTYPIHDEVLTDNPLYRTGRMATITCPEKPVASMNRPQARKYFESVHGCLHRAWRAQLKKVGLPLVNASLGFIDRPRTQCGDKWEKNIAGVYCPDEFRYVILLDRNLLEFPYDLFMFQLAAHEYAHHVQNVTGLNYAFQRHPSVGDRETQEQTRRSELQAECLSGVFTGSAFSSLDRPKSDVNDLLDVFRSSGDEDFKAHDHGKGKNRVAWFRKGFESRDPKSCNTWISESSKVA